MSNGNQFYLSIPPGAQAMISGDQAFVKGGQLEYLSALIAANACCHWRDPADVLSGDELDRIAAFSVNLAERVLDECAKRQEDKQVTT